MAEFTVNPTRLNPYDDLTFRVKWDGVFIPGITRVGGFLRTTEVIATREGGNSTTSHKSTGRTEYDPITLERGLTEDESFETWANLVFNLEGNLGLESSLNELRKDIEISLYNEAGQLVRAYKVFRCWPSIYEPLSTLDANSPSVVIERITLQNEGWERDITVTEPTQT